MYLHVYNIRFLFLIIHSWFVNGFNSFLFFRNVKKNLILVYRKIYDAVQVCDSLTVTCTHVINLSNHRPICDSHRQFNRTLLYCSSFIRYTPLPLHAERDLQGSLSVTCDSLLKPSDILSRISSLTCWMKLQGSLTCHSQLKPRVVKSHTPFSTCWMRWGSLT